MTGTNPELPCRCHELSVAAGNGSLSPLPAWETSFVILGGGGEESHFFIFKEKGSCSGKRPRHRCLQTKGHGENGNALKGGEKKGERGSIWH